MRAFVEVDGVVHFKCLDAGLKLKDEFARRCEVQICAFAQLPLFSGDDGGEEVRKLMMQAASRENIDVLGSTPWQINRPIFDVVLQVWNSGDRFCKIPPAVFDMAEPEKPENYEQDPQAKAIYVQKWRAWNKDKASSHSDRCNVNYKVEIARTVCIFPYRYPRVTSLTVLIYSSSVILFISPITWISVDVPIRSRHI